MHETSKCFYMKTINTKKKNIQKETNVRVCKCKIELGFHYSVLINSELIMTVFLLIANL